MVDIIDSNGEKIPVFDEKKGFFLGMISMGLLADRREEQVIMIPVPARASVVGSQFAHREVSVPMQKLVRSKVSVLTIYGKQTHALFMDKVGWKVLVEAYSETCDECGANLL